ncbi:peptidase M15 [Rhizobium sp. ACO-34A]|nr:DUF882 domain-containing protein [Rhizobium sp. ACO-34A]ATN32742.1 peptidase M15 [Rhizobium sp. ACO-34A]
MRSAIRVMLACLMTLTTQVDVNAGETRKNRTATLKQHDYTAAYTLQRIGVRASCFPLGLRIILAHISRQTGRRLIITSGHRPHSGRSQHTRCYAADFRIPGVSERRILAAAASAPGIGGIGRYCNGLVHVDIGPKRRWAYCGRGGSKGSLANFKPRRKS